MKARNLMLTKAMISRLNEVAHSDFEKAQAMLDAINMVLGTKYGWLAARVVFFDEPDADTATKYKNAHDAWAYAED